MDDKLGAYRTTDTMGKSQLDLVLQVYDGAARAFNTAKEHYSNEDPQAGFEEMEKAKRFVTHLYTTLNFDDGGEVAENLGKLYTFILNESNVIQGTKNLDQIDAIMKVLGNIREGWAGLKEQVQTESAVPSEQSTAPAPTGSFAISG